jgi:TATA-binding protein-associated factor Taf7
MPTMIECMKTLDKKTYFKSCDATEMLIVHSKFLDTIEDKKKLKSPKLIDFDPLKEEGFLNNLYD